MTPFHLTDFELNSNLWFHFCKCQFPVSLFKTSIFFNQLISFLPGGGGGTPHMKGVWMLVGNFELDP